ncbi:GntR family transcriptional regulator [Paracoccus sp. Z330]|uniref:GntR family transcriptional regulator n=1 Tax=Paracoccus onchidii TaxID=3017813 RepID=A0ABT4ZCU7_9RHOB|nr:GntR family transcriptional regulator [Paracoccus onchidii]MDB6177187.1 GntR family transcriptional regulator [Paracoccus onchidii]
MSDLFNPDAFNATGDGPLYIQLHRRIALAIQSGRLHPGDALPSERDMAAMTGLSRVTIRKAVAALVASGQVMQRRGSGTFVAQKVEKMHQALSALTSFTEDMAQHGRDVDSRWISRVIDRPTPGEMSALDLRDAEPVARLTRVRSSGSVPLAVECATLPANILPAPEQVGMSLYAALQNLGLRPVRAVQRIGAANLDRDDAELLQVGEGSAALRIERLAYLASGRAIEFTQSLYRGDAFDFAVELNLSSDIQRNAP